MLVRFLWFSDVDVVYVAPAFFVPLYPKLDDGVVGFVKVLGGMLPGWVVAAANIAADKAQAEVNPPATGF
jgi:hypothetical protein